MATRDWSTALALILHFALLELLPQSNQHRTPRYALYHGRGASRPLAHTFLFE
ncbi:hypothetical protein FVER14953_20254 [Fusarium verticillioides]|nr:hypothetical protein FVER14953_20254 [Fusarium verticillioides]